MVRFSFSREELCVLEQPLRYVAHAHHGFFAFQDLDFDMAAGWPSFKLDANMVKGIT